MENNLNKKIDREYSQHMEYIQQEIMKLFPLDENANDSFLGETYNRAKMNVINDIMYTINSSIYGSVTRDIISLNNQVSQPEENSVETLEEVETKAEENETK